MPVGRAPFTCSEVIDFYVDYDVNVGDREEEGPQETPGPLGRLSLDKILGLRDGRPSGPLRPGIHGCYESVFIRSEF